jgi:hypothetical protein
VGTSRDCSSRYTRACVCVCACVGACVRVCEGGGRDKEKQYGRIDFQNSKVPNYHCFLTCYDQLFFVVTSPQNKAVQASGREGAAVRVVRPRAPEHFQTVGLV